MENIFFFLTHSSNVKLLMETGFLNLIAMERTAFFCICDYFSWSKPDLLFDIASFLFQAVIKEKYGIDACNVGDEGGFAPNISRQEVSAILFGK